MRVWSFQVLDGFRALFLLELSPTVILSNDLLIMIFLSLVGGKRPLTLWASGTVPFYHFRWFFSQWPLRSVHWLEGGGGVLWRSQQSHTVQWSPLLVLCPRNWTAEPPSVSQDSQPCLLSPERLMCSEFLSTAWRPGNCLRAINWDSHSWRLDCTVFQIADLMSPVLKPWFHMCHPFLRGCFQQDPKSSFSYSILTQKWVTQIKIFK